MEFMENRSPITERHVQAIWYDAALRPRTLRTVRGVPVRVVHPGCWNMSAGPDFRHAVLEIGRERRRLVGDVEIHLRSADWNAHGHGADPAYASVVAHVVWHSGGVGAAELPPGCVEICLGDVLRTKPDFSPDEIDLAAYPYARLPDTERPCERSLSARAGLVREVLRAAGRRRLELKARRLSARFMRRGDKAQVFYEETMAAFGYSRNSEVFRLIGEALPWRDLPHDGDAAANALACVADMKVLPFHPWSAANVRPCNAPARRLAAAAALFAEGAGLLDRMFSEDLSSRAGQKGAMSLLRGGGILGARRAAAVLANVVIPFARACGTLPNLPEWTFPEDLNSQVRLAAFRLLGRDHNPAIYSGNGLFMQGLLQIHREFCLGAHPDCSECALAQALPPPAPDPACDAAS